MIVLGVLWLAFNQFFPGSVDPPNDVDPTGSSHLESGTVNASELSPRLDPLRQEVTPEGLGEDVPNTESTGMTTTDSGGASSSGPWPDASPDDRPNYTNVNVLWSGKESPAFLAQVEILNDVLMREARLGVFDERRLAFKEDSELAAAQFVSFIERACDLDETEREQLLVFGKELHTDLLDALKWAGVYSGQTAAATWDGGEDYDYRTDVARFAIDVEHRRQLLELITPLCERRETFLRDLLPASKFATREEYWENNGISSGLTL